jgi:hypothetical protein
MEVLDTVSCDPSNQPLNPKLATLVQYRHTIAFPVLGRTNSWLQRRQFSRPQGQERCKAMTTVHAVLSGTGEQHNYKSHGTVQYLWRWKLQEKSAHSFI